MRAVKIFDEAASLGGPIKSDKMWFFGALRTWGMAKAFAGVYWNKTQDQSLTPAGAAVEGRAVHAVGGSAARRQQRALGIVRLAKRPPHLAGRRQAQDSTSISIIRSAVTADRSGRPTRSRPTSARYKFEPNRFIQLNYNSPHHRAPAARSRLRRLDFAVEPDLAARRRAQRRQCDRRRRSGCSTAPRPRIAAARTTPTGRRSGSRRPT